MDVTAMLLAVPAGLFAGGFATMLVDRIPDQTPLSTRSRCPQCAHQLSAVDTLPVLSWIARRGRCRHCDGAITPAYPAVELVTMALFVVIAAEYGLEWLAVPPVILAVALVALSTIDMYVYRLPDRLVFRAFGLSALAMVAVALVLDRTEALPKAGAGALGYFALLLIAHLVSPRGMGFGDVKLALLLGLHLGWTAGSTYLGWTPVIRLVFYALLLGCLLGVTVGVLVAVSRRRGRDVAPDPEVDHGEAPSRLLQNSFPFGPALAAGTMVLVLFPDLVIAT